jgi:hypothetical protein
MRMTIEVSKCSKTFELLKRKGEKLKNASSNTYRVLDAEREGTEPVGVKNPT